jgi:electron transfer flavoprotein alpha subunit
MELRVLVIAEIDGSAVRRATLSAITFARRALAARGGGSFTILALGSHVPVAELTSYGADRVIVADDPSLEPYLAERHAPTVADMARHGYDLVVATASTFGKDLLPRVAGRLDAGYAGDCTGITSNADALVFERPLYAGNAIGTCQLVTSVQIATARRSAFEPAATTGGESPVEHIAVSPPGAAASRIEHVGFDRITSDHPELADARVVVAGGRGLKDRFFELLDPLATELGAAIGATRAACDAGHAPGDLQVGQTGKVVAPDLYVAVGLSGALQHVAGMKGAKVIVAINRDPEAPIFEVADYGLVGDLFEVVPELTAAIAAHKARG